MKIILLFALIALLAISQAFRVEQRKVSGRPLTPLEQAMRDSVLAMGVGQVNL